MSTIPSSTSGALTPARAFIHAAPTTADSPPLLHIGPVQGGDESTSTTTPLRGMLVYNSTGPLATAGPGTTDTADDTPHKQYSVWASVGTGRDEHLERRTNSNIHSAVLDRRAPAADGDDVSPSKTKAFAFSSSLSSSSSSSSSSSMSPPTPALSLVSMSNSLQGLLSAFTNAVGASGGGSGITSNGYPNHAKVDEDEDGDSALAAAPTTTTTTTTTPTTTTAPPLRSSTSDPLGLYDAVSHSRGHSHSHSHQRRPTTEFIHVPVPASGLAPLSPRDAHASCKGSSSAAVSSLHADASAVLSPHHTIQVLRRDETMDSVMSYASLLSQQREAVDDSYSKTDKHGSGGAAAGLGGSGGSSMLWGWAASTGAVGSTAVGPGVGLSSSGGAVGAFSGLSSTVHDSTSGIGMGMGMGMGGSGGSNNSSGGGGGGGGGRSGWRSFSAHLSKEARESGKRLAARYRSMPLAAQDRLMFVVSSLLGTAVFFVLFECLYRVNSYTLDGDGSYVFFFSYIMAYLISIVWQHFLNRSLIPSFAAGPYCYTLVQSYMSYSLSLVLIGMLGGFLVGAGVYPRVVPVVLLPFSLGLNYVLLQHLIPLGTRHCSPSSAGSRGPVFALPEPHGRGRSHRAAKHTHGHVTHSNMLGLGGASGAVGAGAGVGVGMPANMDPGSHSGTSGGGR